MGAKLSCLANGLYIAGYPPETPMPPRPVSQQELSQRQATRRQPLQLDYSHEHSEDIPMYRRQGFQPQRPRPRSLQIEYENENGEDWNILQGPQYRHRLPQRLPSSVRGREYGRSEDVPRWSRGSLQPQRLRLEYEYERGEGVAGSPRQFRPRQLSRRRSLSLQHSYEYDLDTPRHGRHAWRQSARPQYEIEGLTPPMYVDQMPERHTTLRGSDNGLEEAPPSYEDHVFDTQIDDA